MREKYPDADIAKMADHAVKAVHTKTWERSMVGSETTAK
jgi:hypothetical protein